MTSARSRRSSLLMAKDQFTSYIPTSRYDTPGTFDKNLLVCHRMPDLVPSNLIVKLRQTAQHYGQKVKKIHTSKVKHTQTEQSERRENRYQTHNNESRNEY